MRKFVGVLMMGDGVLQAMGVAELLSTIVERSLRDQMLFAAHLGVGAGLVFVGRSLFSGAKAPPYVLIAALALCAIETTWFNWPGLALRAVYTAVSLVIVLRKTTLPVT